MGDLTEEYFARVSVIKAFKWISKFQPVPKECEQFLSEQKDKAAKLKKRFSELK